MACLRLENIENYAVLKVLNGGNSININTCERVYMYGYQGSEKDDEIKGEGNSYTTEYRQLDPRLGRWLSLDPVFQPWQSPYSSMNNNPMRYNDVKGLKGTDWIKKEGSNKWEYDSGIQTEGEAKTKYGNNTLYKDDGSTFQGSINGKSIGTVTLQTGGKMTWGTNSSVTIEDNAKENPLTPAVAVYAEEELKKMQDKRAVQEYCQGLDQIKNIVAGTLAGVATGGLAFEVAPLLANPWVKGGVSKLGINYVSESISNESINPLNHNALSYPLSVITPGMSMSKQVLIGASSGLAEYKINGNKLQGVWNQNAAITTLKVVNGATSPFFGNIYGNIIRQGIGGNAINRLENHLIENKK